MPTSLPTIAKRYYPKLSEVITVQDLPEFLSFVEHGLDGLLDHIYYKNLQFSKSKNGDSAFYSLDIVSKKISIALPFDLALVLNPDEDGDNNISSFPVSLQYQWGILAFLRIFNNVGFSFDPEAFYELGLQIFRISEDQVLAHTLNYFVGTAGTSLNKYQQVVDDINALYPNADLAIPTGQEPSVASIVALIKQNVQIPVSVSALMFGLYIADADLDTTKQRLQQFYNLIVPQGIEAYVRDLIIPKAKVTLTLSAGIEFPPNVLRPVKADGSPIEDGSRSIFQFAEATLYVDTQTGIRYDAELIGSLIPTYNRIGNTNLIVTFEKAHLDLSSVTNIPEATAAGYAPDFVGLYVKQAGIKILNFGNETGETVAIYGNDLLIGTGGLSGTIAVEAGKVLSRQFGNFLIELDKFGITFRQNSITKCDISGMVTIARFTDGDQSATPIKIAVEVMFKDAGDWTVTAKALNPYPTIYWPNVFNFQLRSLELGEQNGHFFVEVAGTLNFTADIPVLGDILPKGLEINKLVIWDDGHIEFSGGFIQVPKSFTLSVGPVHMEVSHVSISPYHRTHNGIDRQYLCVGFDGMINTGIAGLNAGGNGMKYYFTTDDNGTDKQFDQFYSIDGISIDMVLPEGSSDDDANFILHGTVKIKQPDQNTPNGSPMATEYSGNVSFAMPQIGIGGSAGLSLSPSIPAFLVDVDLEFSTPIPVWGALGIYGFRALFGQHYIASKSAPGLNPPLDPDTATWWDYYKAKGPVVKKQGIQVDKFEEKPGFTLGAGVTLGTTYDSGFTFSAKVFLFLGLPNLLVIDGQAGILRSRLALDDQKDPPFAVAIILGDSSFETSLKVNYDIPDGGSIFSLTGEMDLRFDSKNASAWYINLGKDQPDSARIQASILSFVHGYAYLMISSQGIKAGAGASFGFDVNAGIVAAGFNVSIDLAGHLSFKPFQVGGSIIMRGSAYVKILVVKLSIGVEIGLVVEAPKPRNIVGYIEVSVKIIFKRISARVAVRFGPSDNSNAALQQPITILSVPDANAGYLPATARNIQTGDTFTLNFVKGDTGQLGYIPAPGDPHWQYNFLVDADAGMVTVPLDTFIDFELLKPVKPGTFLGGVGTQAAVGFTELLPPQKGLSDQVTHTYELTSLEILVWKADGAVGQWVPYNIYEAVTALVENNNNGAQVDLTTLKPGYWQQVDKNTYNKFRLLSQDMFSYVGNVQSSLPSLDGRNYAPGDVFCYDKITRTIFVDWKSSSIGDSYPQGTTQYYDGITFTINGVEATVQTDAAFGQTALQLDGAYGTMAIRLSQPVSYAALNFGPNQHAMSVVFMQTSFIPGFMNTFNIGVTPVSTVAVAAGQSTSFVEYKDNPKLIDQIWIYLDGRTSSDFNGDFVIGGHVELPALFTNDWLTVNNRSIEFERALTNVAIYNTSLSAGQVTGVSNIPPAAKLAQWAMDTNVDNGHNFSGYVTGSPDLFVGFMAEQSGTFNSHNIYTFSSASDALTIPFSTALKVEEGSFAFEATVKFDPFVTGVCTLWSKLAPDTPLSLKKGFTLHLSQQAQDANAAYDNLSDLPQFSVWFTCYSGNDVWSVEAKGVYSMICDGAHIAAVQYKNIIVSVDRVTEKITIYIDRLLSVTVDIPAALAPFDQQRITTFLDGIAYEIPGITPHVSQEEGTAQLINEVQILSDTLNKTIQPIWRPNSTYAIRVRTHDTVNGAPANRGNETVFGFRTAGPIGHFHQFSADYQKLVQQDLTGQYKLADLRAYIDFDRSYPDAQGRYGLSKPVFTSNPQIRLLYTQSYINAMFADWDGYQGLTPVKSSLEVALMDSSGQINLPQLIWHDVTPVTITRDNYKMLPPSQQQLFLLNASVSNSCNPMPSIVKHLRQGRYEFPDLLPGKLYTALFTSVYQPEGTDEQRAEVFRYSFKTSLYASFADQVNSMVLDATAKTYAVSSVAVNFSQTAVQDLKKLINDDPSDDPASVLRYAVKFDRLLYGGFALTKLEPVNGTSVRLIVNTSTDDPQNPKLMALLISSAEPFNDPKLTADLLAGTLQIVYVDDNGQPTGTPDANDFIYIHSADTSSALITNAEMNIPMGKVTFNFIEKVYNGVDYDENSASSPVIDLSGYQSN